MLIIRPAQPGDQTAVFEVTRDSFAGLAAGHYRDYQIAGWMNGCSPETYREGVETGRIHVAEVDGRVVGYADALPGEVTAVFVLPEAAGRGVGRKLLEIVLDRARRGHAGAVVLESLLNAVPFYERMGFVQVGPGYSSHGKPETPPIEIVRMKIDAR